MTVYLVRHAKAGSRRELVAATTTCGRCRARGTPGRAASPTALARRRRSPGSCRARTSRCVQTVEPLAEHDSASPSTSRTRWPRARTVTEAVELFEKLARENAVLCSHGDVLGELLDVPRRPRRAPRRLPAREGQRVGRRVRPRPRRPRRGTCRPPADAARARTVHVRAARARPLFTWIRHARWTTAHSSGGRAWHAHDDASRSSATRSTEAPLLPPLAHPARVRPEPSVAPLLRALADALEPVELVPSELRCSIGPDGCRLRVTLRGRPAAAPTSRACSPTCSAPRRGPSDAHARPERVTAAGGAAADPGRRPAP